MVAPAVLLALLAGSAPGSAQHGGRGAAADTAPPGAVVRAALTADLAASLDPVPVEVVYRLGISRDLGSVPLSALHVGDGRITNLRARAGGRPAPVEWSRQARGRSAGRVVLPDRRGPGDSLAVRLTYRVEGSRAEDGRVRIPVVRVPWRPRAAEPGTFEARAILPDSLRVTETFPTVLGSVTSGGGSRVYAVDLHVVPSVVAFRIHEASSSPLSVTLLVDVGVGLVLALLALLGWRALRRQVEGGGSGDEEAVPRGGTG